MKKQMMLFTVMVISIHGFAYPDVGRIAFRVVTIDESKMLPLENVPVTAVFSDRPVRWGDDSVERIERKLTDVKGMCKFTGTSNHGAASCIVDEVPGYYATPPIRYQATNEHSSIIPIPYRCEPYDCVYTTFLQRVEHPIPLYVNRVIFDGGRESVGGFNGTNAILRFDFIADDWLPPEGDGKHADMIIRTSYALRDKVKDGKYYTQIFYDFTSEIEFPGEGNGYAEETIAGRNCGIRIRAAPETGYVSRKTLRFGRRRKKTEVKGVWPDVYADSNDDRCYSFRIRSRFDEKGNLVEAYYGKIYGDFRFRGTDKSGFNGMSFLYYLNPTSLDRNLEWDMKNNLCKKPLRMDYEPIGVRYREP